MQHWPLTFYPPYAAVHTTVSPVVSCFFKDIPVNLSKKSLNIHGEFMVKNMVNLWSDSISLRRWCLPSSPYCSAYSPFHHHTLAPTSPFVTVWCPFKSILITSFIRVTATHSAAQAAGALHCHCVVIPWHLFVIFVHPHSPPFYHYFHLVHEYIIKNENICIEGRYNVYKMIADVTRQKKKVCSIAIPTLGASLKAWNSPGSLVRLSGDGCDQYQVLLALDQVQHHCKALKHHVEMLASFFVFLPIFWW